MHTHTHRQITWDNDIHMAHNRCQRCYALMAEEHKGLFEAVTLIPAARGSCGSAALKPLLAICWGHQKQINQHLHPHRKRIKTTEHSWSQHRTATHTAPDLHSSARQSRDAVLSKTLHKSFKGEVHPEGGITYSHLIAKTWMWWKHNWEKL